MKRLDLYIGKAVVNATLLAWLVVSVLDALFVLLGELGDIGRGDYSLATPCCICCWACRRAPGRRFPWRQ